MNEQEKKTLLRMLALTAESCGSEISAELLATWILDLESYQVDAILEALKQVRFFHSGRLTLAAIHDRIPGGHPSPEQAWAMCPFDESRAAWWTAQMQEAFNAAYDHVEDGDRVAARMTFLEAYRPLLEAARANRETPQWKITLGTDKSATNAAIREGVAKGYISAAGARRMLPEPEITSDESRDMIAQLGESTATP